MGKSVESKSVVGVSMVSESILGMVGPVGVGTGGTWVDLEVGGI